MSDGSVSGPAAHAPGSLLVLGGGIAGASVCYFAAQAGWHVTLLDDGAGRASDVPCALLNPVRGAAGRVDPRAPGGLQLTWALIRALTAAGHPVPHQQQGVLRAVADDHARDRMAAHLPSGLEHRWLNEHDALSPPLAPGWPHRLLILQGGWVAGGALVQALVAASGATRQPGRAVRWDARGATLHGGEQLQADRVVWCGGSVGAGWMKADWAGEDQADDPLPGLPAQPHRGGSLLLTDRALTPLPISTGVYLSPATVGGVLGATFEAPSAAPALHGPALKSLHWLSARAAALSGEAAHVTGIWTGSRLSGELVGEQPGGWWTLAGLGSKGFLLGPLLARALVQQMGKDSG